MQVLILMLFVILLICAKIRFKISKRLGKVSDARALIISSLIMLFVAGLRYDVGYDYMGYYNFFVTRSKFVNQSYGLISRAIYNLTEATNQAWTLFFVFQFLTLLFVGLGIKNLSIDWKASIVVYAGLFFLDSLNIIRQSLAMAIVFFAFKYMKEKKIVYYFVFIIIASFVHSSALLALPIFFIYNYFSVKTVGIVLLSFLGLGRFLVPLLLKIPALSNYWPYFNYIESMGGSQIRYFYIILALFYLGIYLLEKKNERSREIEKEIGLVIFSLVFPFYFPAQFGIRISLYFNMVYITLIPQIMHHENRVKISRIVYLLPVVIYYIVFLIVDVKNTSGYTPYTFYFAR